MSLVAWILSLAVVVALVAGWGFDLFRPRSLPSFPSRVRGAAARASLFASSALLTFLVLEFAFIVIPPQTDSWAFTLASRRWKERYFHPTSALGFRDAEPPHASVDQRFLLALGDSFTAGWGIRDYRDRYQNVLARQLGAAWVPVTRAHGGWHTGHQLQALRSLDFEPDLMVLQYYINDIEGMPAARGRVAARDQLIPPPPVWARWFVENSLLADFVYWRAIRYARQDMNRPYRDIVHELFGDARIWDQQRRALNEILVWSQERRVPLVVLAIPHLVDREASREPLERVMAVFEEGNVPVVDVGARVEGVDPSELVVNRLDSHANEALHASMASWIFEAMQERAERARRR